MAAISSIAAAVTAISAVYGGVKAEEHYQEQKGQQEAQAKKEEALQKKAITGQEAEALARRKQQIDIQRKQILQGKSGYNIGPTGALGVTGQAIPTLSGSQLG